METDLLELPKRQDNTPSDHRMLTVQLASGGMDDGNMRELRN